MLCVSVALKTYVNYGMVENICPILASSYDDLESLEGCLIFNHYDVHLILFVIKIEFTFIHIHSDYDINIIIILYSICINLSLFVCMCISHYDCN